MFGKLIREFAPAARVLVLVLHARRAECITFGGPFHRQFFKALGRSFSFLSEFCALPRCRAVAAAGDDDRARPIRHM